VHTARGRVRVAYAVMLVQRCGFVPVFGLVIFCGSLRVNDPFLDALRPSKSGLTNKHTVKHTCLSRWCPVPV